MNKFFRHSVVLLHPIAAIGCEKRIALFSATTLAYNRIGMLAIISARADLFDERILAVLKE